MVAVAVVAVFVDKTFVALAWEIQSSLREVLPLCVGDRRVPLGIDAIDIDPQNPLFRSTWSQVSCLYALKLWSLALLNIKMNRNINKTAPSTTPRRTLYPQHLGNLQTFQDKGAGGRGGGREKKRVFFFEYSKANRCPRVLIKR